MAAANDSQKKTITHDLDVRVINGQTVYLDKDGNVVRTEKRIEKRKLFADANSKLQAKISENNNRKLPHEQMAALQQQEY